MTIKISGIKNVKYGVTLCSPLLDKLPSQKVFQMGMEYAIISLKLEEAIDSLRYEFSLVNLSRIKKLCKQYGYYLQINKSHTHNGYVMGDFSQKLH